MIDAKTMWRQRISSWRASGETAAEFSRRHGCAPATLKWWASRLKHEPAPASAGVVRLAKVIRSPAASAVELRGGVVIDVLDRRARVTVEAGADRATVELVLRALGVGGAR